MDVESGENFELDPPMEIILWLKENEKEYKETIEEFVNGAALLMERGRPAKSMRRSTQPKS